MVRNVMTVSTSHVTPIGLVQTVAVPTLTPLTQYSRRNLDQPPPSGMVPTSPLFRLTAYMLLDVAPQSSPV